MTGGTYGKEGYVFQKYAPLARFEGNYAVIGAWIVDDRAAGIGIREDDSPITRNTSRFVPHYFE
jgi:glutathionylspermidine synthase